MGLSGLEPPTSRLSGARSNLLSYKPILSGVLPVSIFDQIAIFNSRSELRLRADACPHNLPYGKLVEMMGFEPMTPCLQGRCSPNWATPPLVCVLLFLKNMKNLIILQNWTTNKTCTLNLVVLGYDSTLEFSQHPIGCCQFSIERRWSSRTFRYGYLVTT